MIFSIEKVGTELAVFGDDLSTWAAARGAGFFIPPAPTDLSSLAELSRWVQPRYEAAAVNAFLQDADYYLVAQAHASQHVVVTHEVPSTSVRKVKIPDVCIGLGVKYVTPYEMLRSERARFVLPPAS